MTSINKDAKFKQAIRIANSRSYQERSVPKFLKKIYYILEDNKHNELLAWSNDGLSMIIKKPTDFANRVLPLYFKHNNFSSFIRQLNMYKFKKRKNSHYDHIYSHEFFQRGKIDMLRNIQRRTTESNNVASLESNSAKGDHDAEIERILQENAQYKRIHKVLYTQVEYIENKMKDIKNEVAALHYEQERSKANEKFLKNVLKTLTKVYGFENIANVIECDVEENGELSAVDCTKLNFPIVDEEVQAPDSMMNNRSLSYLQRSHSEEDGFVEKTYQTSSEFQVSEQLPTNDTPQEHQLVLCEKNVQVDGGNDILHVENWDQLGEAPVENDNFPNATLTKQFDRIKSNNSSELVFCRTSSWFIGDLNNDDLLRNKSNNQIICDF